ncbi:MAG: tRNA (adenosine(37)-N6)-threonylcarbamoyltransferase complex dimerization subunit type 1 TsaB [Spirochaetota bacterium]
MILCVETSTSAFSVSLFHNERQVINLEINHHPAHSQRIVSAVDFLLRSIGGSIKDIQEVYTGMGPGSFTGIRIGLSFANTLGQVLNIPLLGVSSLDVLAFGHQGWYNSVVAFIKSRKNQVYTAYYQKGERYGGYRAMKKSDFIEFLRSHGPAFIAASKQDYKEILSEPVQGLNATIVYSHPRACSLYHLVKKCGLKPRRRYIKPLYLREKAEIF